MPRPPSSFPSDRHAAVAIVVLVALGSCRGVWRLPVEEVRARLAAGSHEFLRSPEYADLDPREATRLGADGPFYLSVVYRDLGIQAMERNLLDYAAREGDPTLRNEAALRILEMDLEAHRYRTVLRGFQALEQRTADAAAVARARKMALEALYALGRGQQLLDLANAARSAASDPHASLPKDPDLDLYRAAGLGLTGQAGWSDWFRDLAWYRRASEIHVRASAFLERNPRLLRSLDPAEADLLRAKAALAQGKRETAAELLQWALPWLEPPAGSVVVEEVGRLYLSLGKPDEGIEVLQSTGVVADEWVRQEFVGRLLGAAGRRDEARKALEGSLQSSPDPVQRQRAVWQILNLRMESGERDLGRMFRNARPYIRDAAYFADILDDAITVLLEERAWTDLEAVRDFARQMGLRSIVARADFILARAVSAHLVPRTLRPSGRDPAALLAETLRADPTGYHGLLAAYLTGQTYGYQICEDMGKTATPTPQDNTVPDAARLAEGYLRYGLALRAYRELTRLGEQAPWELALSTARLLEETGHHRESILLASGLVRRSPGCVDRRLLELMYPDPYAQDVRRISGDQGLPVRAVLALVREESAFDAAIVSRAGAVGLTQLMPATAEEMARRLGLDVVSLTDPVSNLTLGLGLLARLRTLTATLARAVMAYNAGLARLRSWEKDDGRLPEELFVEAIPYDETRTYARKVVVSAVVYGALYEGADGGRTLGLFFPELSPVGLATVP